MRERWSPSLSVNRSKQPWRRRDRPAGNWLARLRWNDGSRGCGPNRSQQGRGSRGRVSGRDPRHQHGRRSHRASAISSCVARFPPVGPVMPASSLHGAGGSAHHGLCRMADLAEDRLCLDRLAATAFQNFLPLSATPPFLASQESSGPAVLRCATALKGALPLASGWSIAIEATVVAAR